MVTVEEFINAKLDLKGAQSILSSSVFGSKKFNKALDRERESTRIIETFLIEDSRASREKTNITDSNPQISDSLPLLTDNQKLALGATVLLLVVL